LSRISNQTPPEQVGESGGTLDRRQMASAVDGMLLGPAELRANGVAHVRREHGIVIVVDGHTGHFRS
jgi:hypothetical protein